MERIKKLPFFIKGIAVVMLAVMLVFAAAAGLRALEVKQQKPRVLKAVAALISQAGDEKYKQDLFFEMLQSGKISYSGDLTLTEIEERFLPERYTFLSPYLNKASIQFELEKDVAAKQAAFLGKAVLQERMTIEAEGYMDERECIVRIPGLHESYLSFSPENLKGQYEESLLYTLLGNTVSLPEENLADYIFSGTEAAVDREQEVLGRNYADTLRRFKELYQEINVSKTSQKEDVLWNGVYESCTVYQMSVPAEIMNGFFKDTIWENSGHTVIITEERVDMLVCLNSKKQLLKLETESTIEVDSRRLPFSAAFYPKGIENPWDSFLLETEVVWENVAYGINLICSNDFSQEEHVLHINLAMTQPFVMQLLNMDAAFEPEGEASFDFACEIPGLTADGICRMSPLTENIQKPQAETVPIFKLNLFDILKFTNDLNWNFFKKQE